MFYLKVLKDKGVYRKGKIEFVEKNKTDKKIITLELTEEYEKSIEQYIKEIEELIESDTVPDKITNTKSCKKCAYYDYCYI